MSLSVEAIIMKKRKLDYDDINYLIYNTTNKIDFLTLNYIERSLIEKNGREFIDRSKNKIEVLVALLLENKVKKLHEFYSATFAEYMKFTGNSFEGITSFNLVFIALLHISLKIIRKSTKTKS